MSDIVPLLKKTWKDSSDGVYESPFGNILFKKDVLDALTKINLILNNKIKIHKKEEKLETNDNIGMYIAGELDAYNECLEILNKIFGVIEKNDAPEFIRKYKKGVSQK